MRRAFTLIELLVIVVIMATMVTVSVISVRAGQQAARTRGAARDIFAYIKHARSTALVTQQPSIITYSTDRKDDDVCAKIVVTGAKLMRDTASLKATTLGGKTVWIGGEEPDGDETGDMTSVGDILFSPVSEDVVRGIRIKVLKDGEELASDGIAEGAKNKISVFSNVDYLLGRYAEHQAQEEAAKEEPEETEQASGLDDDMQEPVSIVWEANGRTEPHRVYVYQDGSKPEKGLCIRIDRFGGAKVTSGSEDD